MHLLLVGTDSLTHLRQLQSKFHQWSTFSLGRCFCPFTQKTAYQPYTINTLANSTSRGQNSKRVSLSLQSIITCKFNHQWTCKSEWSNYHKHIEEISHHFKHDVDNLSGQTTKEQSLCQFSRNLICSSLYQMHQEQTKDPLQCVKFGH